MDSFEKDLTASGRVGRTVNLAEHYGESVFETTQRLRWIDGAWSQDTLTVFPLTDAVVTSAFTIIDRTTGTYLLDQSYSNLTHFFGIKPIIERKKFKLKTDAKVWNDPHVVIGGPIDGVWHHWLVQWSARFAILKRLRPDLIENKSVKFLIDERATSEPFISIIRAFGISADRITFITPHEDHILRKAYVVSFLDQSFYYPTIMEEFEAQVRAGLDVPRIIAGNVRLFCSRQGYQTPKRRVANFEDVRPVLLRHGFDIIELGKRSAREQFQLFSAASCVIGVHGADLSGLLFSPSEATLLVLESEDNILTGLAGTYRALAEIRGMSHATMLIDPLSDPSTDYSDFGPRHNRDYLIDPLRLDQTLNALGF